MKVIIVHITATYLVVFANALEINGKDVKSYLQWTLEFSNYVFNQDNSYRRISSKLEELQETCSTYFWQVIEEISIEIPGIRNLYVKNRHLPIVFKIIRYRQDKSRLATPPHFDKSSLSMILDSDDNKVQWRVGKGNNCLLSKMHSPFNYPQNPNDKNHTILFPGLCLRSANIEIDPTPHFVMPIYEKPIRHSLIAFLLIPHLKDTEFLETKATYIQDIEL